MNRICRLFGIQYPIIEGGLAYVGNGLLAAAVSEAGGLGQVGSGGRTASDFGRELQRAFKETDKPLGANIPLSEHHDSDEYFQLVEEYSNRLKAVSLSAGNPRPYIQKLKRLNLRVITLASTPSQALKAQEAGADTIVCEGYEAGGHNGPSEVTTLVLIPAVKRVVRIPIIAAGGIADGRTATAMFCLGADGIQMGTRFVATKECQAHANYKQLLVDKRAEDTVVMERSLGRVTRVLKSPFVNQILLQEKGTFGDVKDLLPLLAGKNNRKAAIEGNVDDGWVNCGQSVELIHDVPSASEVIQRMVSEARLCFEETEKALITGF